MLPTEKLEEQAEARAERDIEELQRYLRRDGAYEGKVDGQWGAKTEAALAQYRRERREVVDRIKVLAERLRVEAEEAEGGPEPEPEPEPPAQAAEPQSLRWGFMQAPQVSLGDTAGAWDLVRSASTGGAEEEDGPRGGELTGRATATCTLSRWDGDEHCAVG